MYHYQRPSFNTLAPPRDGFLAGNHRDRLDPDDPRWATRTAKVKAVGPE